MDDTHEFLIECEEALLVCISVLSQIVRNGELANLADLYNRLNKFNEARNNPIGFQNPETKSVYEKHRAYHQYLDKILDDTREASLEGGE